MSGDRLARTCPKCGLPLAFDGGTPPDVPTCNPLRSPDCWKVVARLKDGKQYPTREDGRAALARLDSGAAEGDA